MVEESRSSWPIFSTFVRQLGGHADCAGGPHIGDVLRFEVRGQNPPILNAYIKRLGRADFVHCTPFDFRDEGAGSIASLKLESQDPYGPSWHTPFLTGNPGISAFSNNETVKRKQGWTSITAGALGSTSSPPSPLSPPSRPKIVGILLDEFADYFGVIFWQKRGNPGRGPG